MQNIQRLEWVDIAKGISIILVVMLYAVYSVGEDTARTGFLHVMIGYATPFRMPEFFLISGLFLSSAIARPWARYADRRIVHYLYFYALWAVIHIALKTLVFDANPAGAATQILFAMIQPYGVLWFIYMLAVVSVAARLLHMARLPHWVVLPAAALLQMLDIHSASYAVTQFAEYFVYFYLGYAAAPLVFKLIDWTSARKMQAIALLAGWALLNGLLVFLPDYQILPTGMNMGFASLPGVHLLLAIAGAMAICVLAGLLSGAKGFGWLNWLGTNSLVIYVAFALPMSVARIILLRTGLVTDVNLLSVLTFAAAMAGPVVLYAIVQRTGWGKFLFERPEWAKLPGERKTRRGETATIPAE